MQIERASPQDAEKLTQIAFAAKRHWSYPEEWMESWRDALTLKPESITSHETHVALIEDAVVGFYALEARNGRPELSHFWVLPEFMGRGVGRALFCHAVKRARTLGFQEFEIESDPNAEGFYQRLGARRIGTRLYSIGQDKRQLPVLIYRISEGSFESVTPATRML